ncbi:MAG: hypothetical protein DMG31_06825 [Acidobacteria bacterium]|nr:MAG: hypothetical protein DMG31_06825 [Acidobacteriota bacterium]
MFSGVSFLLRDRPQAQLLLPLLVPLMERAIPYRLLPNRGSKAARNSTFNPASQVLAHLLRNLVTTPGSVIEKKFARLLNTLHRSKLAQMKTKRRASRPGRWPLLFPGRAMLK